MLEAQEKNLELRKYQLNYLLDESLFGLDKSLKKCVINMGQNRPLFRPFKINYFYFCLLLIILLILKCREMIEYYIEHYT